MKRLTAFLLALLFALPAALAEESPLTRQARLDLTEALGFTAVEAAQFVIEDREEEDGTVRYWHPDHPDWVYTEAYDEWGNIRATTPFDTGYTHDCGESAVRAVLDAARENGWLTAWDESASDALLRACAVHGVHRPSTALRMAANAAQAVQGLFETFYGPEAGWTTAVAARRDETLAACGLAPDPLPFHVRGVRRQTGAQWPMENAVFSLVLFDGETPAEIERALADQRLAGWTAASGALLTQTRDSGEPSGNGLAILEKDGRRQLVQLAMLRGEWRAYPLGENALYRDGDCRASYSGAHGCFVIAYRVGDEEISVYCQPRAWEDGFDRIATHLYARERVNRETGEAEWIAADQSLGATWMKESTVADPGEGIAYPCRGFPTVLGALPMEEFPDTMDAALRYAPPIPAGYTLTNGVNLRAKTSSRSKSLGMLLPGTMLPVIATLPGDPFPWIETRVGFLHGYVSSAYTMEGASYWDSGVQRFAAARRELSLKSSTGLLAGTVGTLPAGTKMHVVIADGDWLYVDVPRGDMAWFMDPGGTFGWVRAADVCQALMPCQLDWLTDGR